ATTAMRTSLADVVRRQLRALLSHLPRARKGHVKDVHQARVASRRLREALPVAAVAAPDLARPGLERDVRRLTRALGAVRELDVALEEFDRDLTAHRWAPLVVDRVRDHLSDERADRERE